MREGRGDPVRAGTVEELRVKGERLVSPPLLIGLGRRSCPRRWTRVSTAKGGHFRARIDAASTQVSPLEWRGEALDLPGDQSARRVGGASGAATWAER